MNRRQNISKDLQMILDGLLMGGCLAAAHFLRGGQFGRELFGGIPEFSRSYWILALVIPLSPLLLDFQGYYQNPLSQRNDQLLFRIAKSGFWLFLVLGATEIFARLEVPSRSVLILFLLLAPLSLLARAHLTRRILIRSHKLGNMGERSVIIGSADRIESFLQGLNDWERLELQILETFDSSRTPPEDILREVRRHSAGRIIFVSQDDRMLESDLPAFCESEGLDVWISAPEFRGIRSSPEMDSAGSERFLVYRKSDLDFWYAFSKRAIDLACSAAGILVLLLPSLVIAAAIRLTSPGPVIFRQVRSGRRGRRFVMLKFRSMVENAPELHASLSGQNEMEGPVFKLERDPRVTPLGEFLRRTSLDEIPQLLNVLRGDMSIVGPRPLPDYETELIQKSDHRRRLSVKPGMTCLWQICGRSSIRNFEEWVRLDLDYIERASLLLDFMIMIRTVPIVLMRIGAK